MKRKHQLGLVSALLITLALSAKFLLYDLAELKLAAVGHAAKQESKFEEATKAIVQPIKAADGERDPLLYAVSDPFKVMNFAASVQFASAAPIPPPVVEANPVAPQFPYRFLGRMVAVDGTTLTYLSRDNALVPIKVGTVLDEVYRVDDMTDKHILLTYMPLNEPIVISMPSAAE